MKQISFTYTKDSGEISERVGLVVSKPSSNYQIIDLSEYVGDEVEINFMIEQVIQYQKELKELQAKYSISSHFRTFKAANMSNITNG